MITLYFFFPVATTLLTLIKSVSLRPPWPNEYRLRLRSWVTQTSRVRIPGTPVTPLLQRPIYPDCACRLQWAAIRCGKHVHADQHVFDIDLHDTNIMSLNMLSVRYAE